MKCIDYNQFSVLCQGCTVEKIKCCKTKEEIEKEIESKISKQVR